MTVMNNEHELYIGTRQYIVDTAPVGLLMLEDGSIICKSEYRQNGHCECIIVSSGENYCGGDDKMCVSLIIN